MKVAIVGAGSAGLTAEMAMALLASGIFLESSCDNLAEPMVIKPYPSMDCPSFKIEKRDDGRSSWAATRRRHNSKR